ncbi:type II secretion system protein F [Vibrio ichthyoenteri ATCC 700023]|uniref:Type II secretion system protein F n=1 Tax=Vibrio ichthyoenteri ATCC 700023 TaxID=870968 RepID=F9RWY7_9VIBR|nr:type II secretion system F family protein [Vibrio ichthyoenteri]EGU48901.1 type II secretion system protein F [Vibrio ichthyoenteri ATCC 700023]
MAEIMAILDTTTARIILMVWFLVVAISVLFYSLYLKVARQNRFSNFGLQYSKKQRAQNMLQNFNQVIGKFVSLSETDVHDKMIAAGIYDSKYSKWLFPIKYGALIVGVLLLGFYAVQSQLPTSKVLIYGCIWLVLCLIGPDLYLSWRKQNLQRKLSERLPYLLDLMGVCVQTGMTIEASMGYLAKEMIGFDKDIAYMLNKTNERAKIVGLAQALEELYVRVPTAEIRSFVMTLNQSLQYGSSIYTVLTTLAVDIREIQMLGLEEKIGKLSAKMSIPLILLIMLPIVILITAPGIMRLMAG